MGNVSSSKLPKFVGSDRKAQLDKYNPGPPTFAVVPVGQCQFVQDGDWVKVPLLRKLKISHDVFIFTFATPDRTKPLNLPTCACVLAKSPDGTVKPYTPCSTNAIVGEFLLMIKIYPEGKMTQHLASMKEGDSLEFRHIKFNVKIQYPFKSPTIGMLVGGTGITPMIQALHALLGNKDDKTKVIVLFGNKTQEDMIARNTLEEWSKNGRLEVTHVLSREPEDSKWKGRRGRVDADLIKEKFAPYGQDIKFFVCGPAPMYESLCGPRDQKEITGTLKDLGYTDVVKF